MIINKNSVQKRSKMDKRIQYKNKKMRTKLLSVRYCSGSACSLGNLWLFDLLYDYLATPKARYYICYVLLKQIA